MAAPISVIPAVIPEFPAVRGLMLQYRMQPTIIFRKPKGCGAIEPATIGILVLRLTVDGKASDLSTGLRVRYDKWNAKAQKVRGQDDEARMANSRIADLKSVANDHYFAAERRQQPLTADGLRLLMTGGGQVADESLLVAWDMWNQHQQKRLAAGEIGPATAGLPSQRRRHLTKWLQAIKRPGLLARELTPSLVRDFRMWLLSPAVVSIKSGGYATKTARLLAECCACAVERGALQYHPCPRLRMPNQKPGAALYVQEEQLQRLAAMELSKPLAKVRDGFLFQCYTGLAWADAREFKSEYVSEPDAKGQRWLRMPRKKTGQVALVPLLTEAAALVERYAPGPVPVCANQLYNLRLSLLGERLGLSFQLTSHIGRKTFAMLAYQKGVSIDVIAAMLGHANLKHTPIYAQMQEARVAREMEQAGFLEKK